MKRILQVIFILALIPSDFITAQNFLHREGKYIYDGAGNEVILRGIGTGNWMLQEGYMMKSTDAGINTQWQFRKKLIETIGEVKTDSFYNVWLDNHFTRTDVDSMKAWGFNSVRPALHYKWFTLPIEEEPVPGLNTWIEEGFERLDSLVAWCTDNEMYVFLDMHGAPGGQGKNADISDYDPSKPSLWESEHNLTKLTALWYEIAKRYKDEPWVGGFDLINEINWDFENSGNQNGCNCSQNKPIIDIFERIIDTIRTVNTNHMVFVSGNCWGNNYNGMDNLAHYDDNLAITFHKYWSLNSPNSIDWIIEKRENLNVPVWMSESGENSNTWFTNATSLFESKNIGWSWWPVKKGGINNVIMVSTPQEYTDLLNYWKNGTPYINENQAFEAVLKWADNHKIENCTIQYDVIDALTRQINSYETIPFKNHTLGKEIFFADYDLGRNNVAYFDTDTANHHIDTDNYTAWNQGWAYRNDGVDIETCSDTDTTNGFSVGWTNDGEWMEYTVVVDSTAGYTLKIRSASGSSGSKVHLVMNGLVITEPVSLPGTSGWQNWQTTEVDGVILSKGTHKIRFKFDKGGSNLNYFTFTDPVATENLPFNAVYAESSTDGKKIALTLNKPVTSSIDEESTSSFSVTCSNEPVGITTVEISEESPQQIILVLNEPLYYGGIIKVTYEGNAILNQSQYLETFSDLNVTNRLPVRFTIPGRIQAEDFSFNNGLVIENCSDAGGGFNMGYATPGDYLDYRISVPESKEYTIDFRIATIRANSQLILQHIDGNTSKNLDTLNITPTGGWQTWQTMSINSYLEEGRYTLRLYVKSGEFNTNWFFISAAPVVGIKNEKNPGYRIYPNPSNGFIVVDFREAAHEINKINIYSANGSLVKTIFLDATNKVYINTSILKPGVYYLSTEGKNSSNQLSRFIIY